MAVHIINQDYNIVELNNNHYLEIQTEFGATHESSFFNLAGNIVRLNNNNNTGLLGKGSELKGKQIVIKSNAENNTPNPGVDNDRIYVSYQINNQVNIEEVALYNKEENEDDYPTIKVIINII